MKTYHRLETEILSLFRNISADENNKEIIKLLRLFQKYWKSYQDNWSGNYWEIYNLVYEEANQRNEEELKYNVKQENLKDFNVIEIKKFNNNEITDPIFISEDEFKNGLEKEKLNKENENHIQKNKFIFDEDSFFSNKTNDNNNENINKHKLKNSITKDQTKSITNLEDIDKELDGVLEKSLISGTKDDRKRHCLDCNIL